MATTTVVKMNQSPSDLQADVHTYTSATSVQNLSIAYVSHQGTLLAFISKTT